MSSPVATETVLEALTAALGQAARHNRSAMVAPAAVLWPDEAGQWEPLVPLLRELLPAFLTLGDYAPEERTGPAIWMRCLLAGELGAAGGPRAPSPSSTSPASAARCSARPSVGSPSLLLTRPGRESPSSRNTTAYGAAGCGRRSDRRRWRMPWSTWRPSPGRPRRR